jgi:hypothetical protein
MTEEQMSEFQVELEALAEKWNLRACSFTGTAEDKEDGDKYLGIVVGKMTPSLLFETVLNTGRLWQHLRNQTRSVLDGFERGKMNR